MDISESAIQASEKGLNRLIEMTSRLNDLQVSNKDNDKIFFIIKDWEKKCFDCLNDDFNTPMLIAEIFNSSKLINEIYTDGDCGEREKLYFLDLFDIFLNKIMGVNYSKSNSDNDSILDILLGLRDKARANKNFEINVSKPYNLDLQKIFQIGKQKMLPLPEIAKAMKANTLIRDQLLKLGIRINDKD